jgi:hypothetical protein
MEGLAIITAKMEKYCMLLSGSAKWIVFSKTLESYDNGG